MKGARGMLIIFPRSSSGIVYEGKQSANRRNSSCMWRDWKRMGGEWSEVCLSVRKDPKETFKRIR